MVTMKAMHGCKRMRHSRAGQDEHTHRYDSKPAAVDYRCMLGIAFQGARCSESNVGMVHAWQGL